MYNVLLQEDLFLPLVGLVCANTAIDLFIVDTKYYTGEVCRFSYMFKFEVKLSFTDIKTTFLPGIGTSLLILFYIVHMYALYARLHMQSCW